MKLAFLYAGQGSQKVGMGKDFYDEFASFREIFDTPQTAFDLKALCFEGPQDTLNKTKYTQPCMVAFAAGVTALLFENGVRPEAVAGLSLGEYSALYAAGVFSAGQAVETVAFRGNAMEKACTNSPGGMAAILGLDRDVLQEVCDKASHLGKVCIANYNCPGQLVIGGEQAALDEACNLAKQAGARRCMPLSVSGAFHTELMAPAAEELCEFLQGQTLGEMKIPVYFNCLGTKSDEDIKSLLLRQIQSGVRMEDTIRNMAADGIDTIVEIGPGKVLGGFVRKTCPEMTLYSIENVEDFHSVLSELKGANT